MRCSPMPFLLPVPLARKYLYLLYCTLLVSMPPNKYLSLVFKWCEIIGEFEGRPTTWWLALPRIKLLSSPRFNNIMSSIRNWTVYIPVSSMLESIHQFKTNIPNFGWTEGTREDRMTLALIGTSTVCKIIPNNCILLMCEIDLSHVIVDSKSILFTLYTIHRIHSSHRSYNNSRQNRGAHRCWGTQSSTSIILIRVTLAFRPPPPCRLPHTPSRK